MKLFEEKVDLLTLTDKEEFMNLSSSDTNISYRKEQSLMRNTLKDSTLGKS